MRQKVSSVQNISIRTHTLGSLRTYYNFGFFSTREIYFYCSFLVPKISAIKNLSFSVCIHSTQIYSSMPGFWLFSHEPCKRKSLVAKIQQIECKCLWIYSFFRLNIDKKFNKLHDLFTFIDISSATVMTVKVLFAYERRTIIPKITDMVLNHYIFTNSIQKNSHCDDQSSNKNLHYSNYSLFVNSVQNEYSI